MFFQKKGPPHVAVLIITDLFLSILAIAILAFFPTIRSFATKWTNVSSLEASETPIYTAMISASPTPASTPTPAPTPTATPTPVKGDFSAAFAKAEIAENSDNVYRSDDYIIAIEENYVEDAVTLVADVYIRDIHLLKSAFAYESFKGKYSRNEDMLELCSETNALFAVTGDYVSIREDGLVIRNGEILQKNPYNDICVLYLDGTLAIYDLHEITRDELMNGDVWQTWCFGPKLLDENGQPMEIQHKLMRQNPRCAIGYYEPGHYCFVIVDGRQKYYSDGMTLTELSAYMAELGCKVAYNLDGGQTAQMVLDDRLVNMPANGGRRVGDIIYIERAGTEE